MKKICVVGSINAGIVNKVDRFPDVGETISSKMFSTFNGGKGANQAVAAGRLGADVVFLGVIGDDTYGQDALRSLKSAGVDTSFIGVANNTNTGVAVITVDGDGNNSIVISDGANAHLNQEYIKKHLDIIDQSDIIMLQLETPIETIQMVAAYAKNNNKTVILDPAPAIPISCSILENTTIITPNETELRIITSLGIHGLDDIKSASNMLLDQGLEKVVHKAGDKGAYLVFGDSVEEFPGYSVKAMDTTAAGDSFNGGLAYALAEGREIEDAIRFANAVAAISVTKFGAQTAMPTLSEVENFIVKTSI